MLHLSLQCHILKHRISAKYFSNVALQIKIDVDNIGGCPEHLCLYICMCPWIVIVLVFLCAFILYLYLSLDCNCICIVDCRMQIAWAAGHTFAAPICKKNVSCKPTKEITHANVPYERIPQEKLLTLIYRKPFAQKNKTKK